MEFKTAIDENQNDIDNRDNIPICPDCGQKLFAVVSLHRKGLIRIKCRKCKKYVLVKAINTQSAG